jgi:hypothetical protein
LSPPPGQRLSVKRTVFFSFCKSALLNIVHFLSAI